MDLGSKKQPACHCLLYVAFVLEPTGSVYSMYLLYQSLHVIIFISLIILLLPQYCRLLFKGCWNLGLSVFFWFFFCLNLWPFFLEVLEVLLPAVLLPTFSKKIEHRIIVTMGGTSSTVLDRVSKFCSTNT
jgi:hypothetical protein